jgi:hypothetical protein
MEKVDEPPSCSSNLVLIGQNSRGNWVARESHGLFGGLFVSRAQAVKYALSENGDHPATIVLTDNVVELDMHRKASSAPPASSDTSSPPEPRRVGVISSFDAFSSREPDPTSLENAMVLPSSGHIPCQDPRLPRRATRSSTP